MRYRKLTSNLDFQFGSSQLDFYKDVPEAVAQAAQTRLLLWLAEWFLNLEEGTPYLQGILGKYSKETADLTIRDRVFGTQDLTGISAYESVLDGETRALSVAMTIETAYGPTSLEIDNYSIF